MAKISIIVPICNVEKYLPACLESVIEQTLEDIEIICVDDCSEDGSREILLDYARKDSRIHTILHPQNLSTSQARKDGVAASTGKYIMFLDGDDRYTADACEKVWEAMEEKKTDILQFGTDVVNFANAPEERIALNKRLLAPYLKEEIYGDIINACWEEKKFGFSLWNKAYSGDLCREAFSRIEDGSFPKAQDVYAFFVIATMAKSYGAIPDEIYRYSFGTGITGKSQIDLNRFQRILTEADVCAAMERYCAAYAPQYEETLKKQKKNFLNDCLNNFLKYLRTAEKEEGLEMLCQAWGIGDVISSMACQYWFNSHLVEPHISGSPLFRYEKRSAGKKTIGFYYRNIRNGGAQRVVALLCNILSQQKDAEGEALYRVILITEDAPAEDEYALCPEVKRFFIPSREDSRRDYLPRYLAWQELIDTWNVDLVVSGMWIDGATLWDMMSVKSHRLHPAFVLHAHSFCCVPYRSIGNTASSLAASYRLADGVVTLSACDQAYAEVFNPHVACIMNPISLRPDEISPSPGLEHNLVWVGRISAEKQPWDAVYMMEYLVKQVPDAKLYMVGDGDPKILEELKLQIADSGMEEHIILTGFTSRVSQYYEKGAVYISTALYEGAGLTFYEAMCHSLPVVSYNMPWLTHFRDGRGIITVEQNRVADMADAAAKLLLDKDYAKQMGKDGNTLIREMLSEDTGAKWSQFFQDLDEEADHTCREGDYPIIFRYLVEYQQYGRDLIKTDLNGKLKAANERAKTANDKLKTANEKLKTANEKLKKANEEKKKLNNQLKKAKRRVKILETSTTFRVGKVVMFLPVSVKKCVKKLLKMIKG